MIMPRMLAQWLSLVAVIWLQSINGTNTNFPAYSSQLKETLSISQVQLNNLAFASDAGKLLGWLSGIAAVHLPLWVVLSIGTSLGLVGYGVQYLFVAGHIASLSYAHIFLLTVLAGNSICWINTVCYIVSIRNFPFHRQVAVGLNTSYQGLSANIYTAIVSAIFGKANPAEARGRATTYLLLNSVLPAATCVITAPFVRDISSYVAGGGGARSSGRDLKAGFIALFVITLATGIYAVVSSMESVSDGISPLNNAVGTGIFLMIPLAVPLVESRQLRVSKEERVHDVGTVQEGVTEVELEGGIVAVNGKDGEVVGSSDDGANIVGGAGGDDVGVREEIGAREMMKRLDFWLYFFVYLFGATIGLVFLNNLGQIAESRGSPNVTSLVALSSAFGFFGRLIPALLDYFLSRINYVVPRPASMAALMAPMVGAYFLLLCPAAVALHASTAVVGVCTGAITSISVSTTTELFGATNFGVNHNILVANIPIGSFVFGYTAAIMYRRRGGVVGSGKCIGMECYRTTFVIWGCLCLLGTVLALVLHVRTRKFYSRRSSRR